jgi:glycosyltransferase involved in cell wall biosynthesis
MKEGGIFTILDNCLQRIETYNTNKELRVIALVADKTKFNYKNIHFVEFKNSKSSWFLRLYYEYFYFKTISKRLKPDTWISLHDTTPNVVCKNRYVYCHHPTIFYKSSFKDWKFDYKIGLFSKFYTYLHQINIKKNTAVIVQQQWIKEEFEKRYNIQNVIISNPDFTEETTRDKIELEKDKIHFFYPSFPRTFKNFELIFEMIPLLDKSVREKVKFHFTTIKDNPNKYAQYLFENYNSLEEVVFLEQISRAELLKYYNSVNCIIFPSKLETWGLPISEAKAFKKPILLANLPYAKESVGNYDLVSFFDVNNPKELALLITQFVHKTIVYQGNHFNSKGKFNDWHTLFDFILKKN